MTTAPEPVATLPDLPAPTSAARRFGGVALCLLVYAAACAAPALVFQKGGEQVTWLGAEALLVGWMGVLSGELAWLANLALFMAWSCVLVRARLAAVALSLVALWLAHSTLGLTSVLANEAGDRMLFQSTGVGFELWRASMVLTIVVALVQRRRDRRAHA